ncbi:hypothetical protein Ddc_23715 [Ditylenchus destructor]|nr:hypothetical protein Ddc_23715 [Ditylenchus destructor]
MSFIADSKFLSVIPTFWLLITIWIFLIIQEDHQKVEGTLLDLIRKTCTDSSQCKDDEYCFRRDDDVETDSECKCRSKGSECFPNVKLGDNYCKARQTIKANNEGENYCYHGYCINALINKYPKIC